SRRPDSAPERAETGTQNHEGIAGAAAAVDFLASLAPGPTRRGRLHAALRQLHERGDALITQLRNGLREIGRVHFTDPRPAQRARRRSPSLWTACRRYKWRKNWRRVEFSSHTATSTR